MTEPLRGGHLRLELEPKGFAEVERLVAYETANALLMLNLDLQHRVGLRAEEYQVYMLVVRSTVQRLIRAGDAEAGYLDRTPLPRDRAGAISRRRISEVLGIPLETLRRNVSRLLGQGLIVEHRRGSLSTPGGTLAALGEDATPERVVRRFIAATNAMIRAGAVRSADHE